MSSKRNRNSYSTSPPAKRLRHEKRPQPNENQYEERLKQCGNYKEKREEPRPLISASQKKPRAVTFRILKEWAIGNTRGDKLVEEITTEFMDSFKETLCNKEKGMRNTERIEYVFTVFQKISNAPIMTRHSKNIFEMLKTSEYFYNVAKVIFDKNFRLSDDFYENIIPAVINKYLNFFPDGITDIPIDGMLCLSEVQQFQDELNRLRVLRKEWLQNKRKECAVKEEEETFRSITTYPTDRDIHKSKHNLLKAIPVKGGFTDAKEYLSTQFHLLREDLIAPIRDGIWEVKKNTPYAKRKHKLWQLTGVSLHKREWSNKGLVYCLQFDKEKTKKIKWKYSRRLLSCNLICLSKDNFETFIFGTVIFRKVEELEQGFVKVKFLNVTESDEYLLGDHKDMIILESNVLLESYTHVLEGLKNIDEENFPFYDYIIKCNPIQQCPKYVRANCFYDLSNILTIPIDKVEILSNSAWPDSKETNLNLPQLEAFKSALTNEFVVIQGPPGTGKTYLSLEIADSLLKNKTSWKEKEDLLLVVSYTNHALDQFVEGLISRGYGSKLVRIGGRFADHLRPYSLFEKRSEKRKNRSFRPFNRERKEIMNSVSLFDDERHFNNIVLEGSYVPNEDYFNLMKESHFQSFVEKNIVCKAIDVSIFCIFLNLVDFTEKDLRSLLQDEDKPLFEREPLQKHNKSRLNVDKPSSKRKKLSIGNERQTTSITVNQKKNQTLFDDYEEGEVIFEDEESDNDFEFLPNSKESKHNVMDLRRKIAERKSSKINYPSERILEDFQKTLTNSIPYSEEGEIIFEDEESDNDFEFLPNSKESKHNVMDLRRKIAERKSSKINYPSERILEDFQKTLTNSIPYSEEGEIIFEDEESDNDFEFLPNSKESKHNVMDLRRKIAERKSSKINYPSERILEDFQKTLTNSIPYSEEGEIIFEDEESDNDFEFLPNSKESKHNVMDLRRKIAERKSSKINYPSERILEDFQKTLTNSIPYSDLEVQKLPDPWSLYANDRLRLYKHWLTILKDRKMTKRKNAIHRFEEECKKIQEYDNFLDKEIIAENDIIAMTTTGAAKNRHILSQINSKIVIVEEAAEVLESHVITSLMSSTQHLILTGDHKQLKPKPTVFKLAKDYNMDLSLFERMVNNGIKHHTLNTQHRMRPEISKLLRHIYPDLKDGDKVNTYDKVKGVTKNIFFISHKELERDDDGIKSKSNVYEVKYLVQLCSYLLKQGYKREQITILAGYTGQVLLFKKEMPYDEFKGVRVTSIDNFQGEENDIILVSLVRSNAECKLGFMKNENRVCVALSRAKIGLFVIGNLEMFADSETENNIWGKIVEDMKSIECIGNVLQLCCQNHCDDITEITKLEDFSKVPNGCCDKDCNVRLKCGHTCTRKCHVDDSDHKIFKCEKKCDRKVCISGVHDSICREDCHNEKTDCMKCLEGVDGELSCGHVQTFPCSFLQKLSEIECSTIVEKQLRCGHKMDMGCSVSIDNIKCNTECTSILKCGHKCSGSCGECFQEKLHVKCKVKCGRRLICSHICQEVCTRECPPCPMKCQVKCGHNKCSKKCGKACSPCRERCQWKCEHQKCGRKCHEMCDRERCDVSCQKKLKCGHRCIGLCGEECPHLCRKCNRVEVETILFGNEDEADARFIMLDDCKHIIEVNALDQWMNENIEDGIIKFKECPKCKTIIRSSKRYGNQIKMVENDINITKEIIRGKNRKNALHEKKEELFQLCKETYSVRFSDKSIFFGEFQVLGPLKYAKSFTQYKEYDLNKKDKFNLHRFLYNASESLSVTQINDLLAQVKYLKQLLKFASDREKELLSDSLAKKDFNSFLEFLTTDKWASEQYLADFESEFKRFELYLNTLQTKTLMNSFKNEENIQTDLKNIDETLDVLHRGCKVEDAEDHLEKFKEIRIRYKMKPLTKEDMAMIVKAMTGDVRKGAWYKCKNGHIYAIGNCGGAMVQAKCPECQDDIGGTSHRLVDGNELAGEMDGASHSAWSEQVNMGN